MVAPLHDVRFPNESDEYRAARDELLRAEIDLRDKIEAVAALRRKLPVGGKVKEDYVFEEIEGGRKRETRLSELFAPAKPSLIVYSFMYAPEAKHPCPMCTSFLDGFDRAALHVGQRVSLAVVAKSPIERIHEWGETRGWSRLRFLSSHRNTYNADYFAERDGTGQTPVCNVFERRDDGIRHFWSSELFYCNTKGHPRHIDLLWPVWSFFDLTPEGRGNFMPKLAYD